MTSNKRLDFGGDPDQDADPGIFKGMPPLEDREVFVRVLPITREAIDEFLRNFLRDGNFGMSSLATNLSILVLIRILEFLTEFCTVTYVTSRERKLTIELGWSGFKIDWRECD